MKRSCPMYFGLPIACLLTVAGAGQLRAQTDKAAATEKASTVADKAVAIQLPVPQTPSPTKTDVTVCTPDRGHSQHGAAFDEGPRQQAHLEHGFGAVHFPITTKSPDAQRFFDQGINLLYSFSYYEAERSFRQAIMLDPDCAMAYWGLARADGGRAQAFLTLAKSKLSKVTDRERRYIEAELIQRADFKGGSRERDSAYVHALEQLILAYPDDLEAKLVLERSLPDEADGKSNRIAKDALLEQVIARNPHHPGAHHFRIHLWDGKDGVAALDSCKAYPLLAPNIGHAQHMPGHIYAQLGMWDEAALAMDRAARVERRYFYTHGQMPFDSWNYAHDQHYLIANLGYLGRINEGIRLAQELIDVPHDPKWNTGDGDWDLAGQGRFAMLRMLVRGERWDAILNDKTLAWSASPEDQAWKLYSMGLAYLGKGDRDMARKQSKSLDDLKGGGDTTECARLELRGRLAFADGDTKKGIETLKKAAEIEQTKFFYNDPPPFPRPLYESLAWGYLQTKQWSDAETALHDGLKRDPHNGFALGMLVLALKGDGKTDEAEKTFVALRTAWKYADTDLPIIRQVQTACATDTRLRALCDTGKSFSTPYKPGSDLEHLGPSAWRPFPAPDFTLLDPNGKAVRLSEFRGHNLLLVFTLGGGCARCVRQLDGIGKEKAAFAALDTRMVAVSSDKPAATKALTTATPNYPYLLLSDPTGATQRAYKAYDEFENLELHATVLIDKEGRVWWQRAGGDPFTDAAFLKAEIARMNDWGSRHPAHVSSR